MLRLAIAIIVISVASCLAAWGIDIARLFNVTQPVTVCLSIMGAAVFVRLNRGMPTLDWKSLTASERIALTKSVLDLTRDYVLILGLNVVAIGYVVFLSAVGKDDAILLPMYVQRGLVGVFVFVLGVAGARVGYVVWRDFDIVRLQKKLIDDSGTRDEQEAAKKEASEKVTVMRSSGLKAPPPTPIQPWSN
ncbi:hypothetical protein [Rhizobium ruizarguesonis]|uniref:hypothetical protein n=1 Tax=Rhizobium ruizarguesonis TaxID=2081791 RepID=UPI002E0D8D5C|nr:hypothetical protein U8Q07_24630 [Rhizobium ruizarguesonis]WSH33663.1 hypothetical protein U8P70_24705 [Rhizobium ruizarguesonis]